MSDGTSESSTGAFREAIDLVRETVGRLDDAWRQLVTSVQELIGRARLFLREDAVWSAVLRDLPGEVAEAIATIDGLLSRLRPGVDRILETLRTVVGRTAPMLAHASLAAERHAAVRWALAKSSAWAGNVAYAANLGHLGADLTGQFVEAAIEADRTTPGSLPTYAGSLRRLADRVDQSVRRTADWTAELQRLLSEAARVADLR
ncbi:hypothetical protein AB0J83_38460 [Actinoplanes sp. NPDC049596]|uniref:hypothetical protein n=1 Tax=unclassified Actinoplanes TaxID=2626549 RepID=UPI003437BD98